MRVEGLWADSYSADRAPRSFGLLPINTFYQAPAGNGSLGCALYAVLIFDLHSAQRGQSHRITQSRVDCIAYPLGEVFALYG